MTQSFFCALVFLFSSILVAGTVSALQWLGKIQAEEKLKERFAFFFFKRPLHFFFGKARWEGLLFSLNFTKVLLQIGFALSGFFFFSDLYPTAISGLFLLGIALIILCVASIAELIPCLFSEIYPMRALCLFAPGASLALLLSLPWTALFFRIFKAFLPKNGHDSKRDATTFRIRDKVHELLQETELGAYLEPHEHKLILSIVSFKERIAREVMVPRINMFSLSSDSTLEEAAQSFFKENYSRIPVYKENVDNIIGVLHYKDVLKSYVDQRLASQKVDKLVKPVLYTPETKKITHLLQEFRSKQIHLAIVVDEWGGTEGIVTIEDILEELVGEIADEYDVGQELFTPLPTGGWIVDSKMSILDIQEELGVQIPQGPEYDTIGGYIYHRAGSIPAKGWRIHHDDFDLEVLSSSERAVEKIKIIPLEK